MNSNESKHLLLRAPFAIVVAILTILVGYQLIHQWPLSERDKARRHSVQLWGTKPLTAHLVSQGDVQPSSNGPYRSFTFRFTDKFGQIENVSGNFALSKTPSKEVKVWQKQSTGNVYLPATFDPGYGGISATLPYYDGGNTQGWFILVGLVGTVIVLFILIFIALLIYDTVDGRVEEIRRDRQLKQKKAATTTTS